MLTATDRDTELADRRREIMAEQQRQLAEVEAQIRRQRLDDLRVAEAALQQAYAQRDQLEAALQSDAAAKRVQELHERFSDLTQQLENLPEWRPSPELAQQLGRRQPGEAIPLGVVEKIDVNRTAHLRRGRELLEQVRQA